MSAKMKSYPCNHKSNRYKNQPQSSCRFQPGPHVIFALSVASSLPLVLAEASRYRSLIDVTSGIAQPGFEQICGLRNSAVRQIVLDMQKKKRRHSKSRMPALDSVGSQLRLDLEDDSVAISTSLFRRSIQIAQFVEYQVTERVLTVAATRKNVKRCVRPGAARLR